MKNLELKDLGVQEMNTAEMTQVEGGGLIWDTLNATLGIVTTTAGNVIKDTTAFVNKQVGTLLAAIFSL